MKIDLHIHSNFSDGEESPSAIAKKLHDLDVSVAALTDHDTVEGVHEFLSACSGYGIKAVSGIEVSSIDHKEVHILGYNIDYQNKAFLTKLNRFKELRISRNSEILRQLEKCKVFISEKDISAKSGETIGRMHIAKVMKQKGYVANIGEAFDKFLAHGRKAYVRSFRPKPQDAISLIVEYGGMPVLAHPMKLQLDYNEIGKLVEKYKEFGLAGVEVYYPSHSKNDIRELLAIASKLKIMVSCGSDYHGEARANSLAGVECDAANLFLIK